MPYQTVETTPRRTIARIAMIIVNGIRMITGASASPYAARDVIQATLSTEIADVYVILVTSTVEITRTRTTVMQMTIVSGIKMVMVAMVSALLAAAVTMKIAKQPPLRNVRWAEITNDPVPTRTVRKRRRIKNVVVSRSKRQITMTGRTPMTKRALIRSERRNVLQHVNSKYMLINFPSVLFVYTLVQVC